MGGLNITITQLLSYLAAYECFLAGMLVCAFCFLTSIKHVASAKDEPRRLADRWRFVFALRMAGLGAFATFTFENYVNQTLHKGGDWFQTAVATIALAVFVGIEAFAARRAVQIVLRRGGRIGLALCLGLHFVLMCVLAHAALFAWNLFPQTGLPYFKLVLKWDPLYVLVAVLFSLLIAGIVGSFVRNRLRLSLSEYFAGAVSSFIICAYLLLIPVQARYLVLMLPGSDDGSLDFNTEYYASEARVEALRRLVPWMIGYKPLDGLKAAWWDSVTIRFETPDDPVYMEQLRRAASAGQRSSLERLWVKRPGEAREIAELLLAAAQSPMNIRHFVLGEGPAVLFLEDPNRELFKVLIPDEKRRTELHQLLLHWTDPKSVSRLRGNRALRRRRRAICAAKRTTICSMRSSTTRSRSGSATRARRFRRVCSRRR